MAETGARKWIIGVTVVLSAIMEVIDTTIGNVSFQQDLLRYLLPFDFAFRQRLRLIVNGLMGQGSSCAEAQRQAFAAREGILTPQPAS